jgi:hypothetical protein
MQSGEIRHDDKCLDYIGGIDGVGARDKIYALACHGSGGNQNWSYSEVSKQIKHFGGLGCLEILDDKVSLVIQSCNESNQRQIWHWKKREKKYRPENNMIKD